MTVDGDRIELRGLRLNAVVGVLGHERTKPQPIELDIDLHGDLRAAGRSDDLTATTDYGAVTDAIAALVSAEAPLLLERFAELVAERLLEFDTVRLVTVSVRKLRPPVAHQLATSGVRITRPAAAVARPR